MAYRFSAGCGWRFLPPIGQWFGQSRVKDRCSCGRTARYYSYRALETPLPKTGRRSALPHPHEVVAPEVTRRQVEWVVGAGIHRVVMDVQRQQTQIGELRFGSQGHEVYTIGALAESARMEAHRVQRYTRPGWDIKLQCDTELAWQAGGWC